MKLTASKIEEIKLDIIGRFVIGSAFHISTSDVFAGCKIGKHEKEAFYKAVGGIEALRVDCWAAHDEYWGIN